ncbi:MULTISPECIES: DUF2938 domain-containing protein [Enterobacterales]|nr:MULTISPECIES: DUF2938 domain-containing protein [Enterobacterales]WOO51541.1 DUF2938 domain-containing protein [Hafnia alvei]MCT6516752.1 DUF2938 domain-containing protein [Proteus vulgaris]ODQ04794.1 hypothetical protein BGK50_05825 [Shigella sp. FC130]OEI92329.1 hypothetical protein BHE86_07320 [Shigella sp. FC1655]OEJ04942.1 hypothetical protein BHE89_07460 [Shigella sp. FC1967]
MSTIILAVILGVGATVIMDLWAVFLALLKIPTLNLSMIGRWIGHMFKGQYFHHPISQSAPIKNETALGWCAHYGIGIVFAFIFLIAMGEQWLTHPTFWSAYLWGVITIIAPYFMMQPALGAGVMASKTPFPNKARLLSFLSHSAYGVGLYFTGVVVSWFF